MERLNALADTLSKFLLALGGVAMVLMMLHICADIFSKYVFGHAINATLEIVAWYYMISCVFLPIAYVQARKQNLVVEMFTMGLSERATAILDGFVALISIAYVGLLTRLVFNKAIAATLDWEIQDVTYFDLPVWPVRWILPMAFGLMTFIFMLQAYQDFRFGFTGRGRPSMDAAKDASPQIS